MVGPVAFTLPTSSNSLVTSVCLEACRQESKEKQGSKGHIPLKKLSRLQQCVRGACGPTSRATTCSLRSLFSSCSVFRDTSSSAPKQGVRGHRADQPACTPTSFSTTFSERPAGGAVHSLGTPSTPSPPRLPPTGGVVTLQPLQSPTTGGVVTL